MTAISLCAVTGTCQWCAWGVPGEGTPQHDLLASGSSVMLGRLMASSRLRLDFAINLICRRLK